MFSSQSSLLMVYWLGFEVQDISSCECQNIFHVLMRHGLFPTAPSQPRMVISTDLLDFFRALFERSCDAVNALASTLNSFYTRRGFRLLNKQVCLNLLTYPFIETQNRMRPSTSLFVVDLVMPFSGMTLCGRKLMTK